MKLFLFTLLALTILCSVILLQQSRTLAEKRTVVTELSEKVALITKERPSLKAVVGGTKSHERVQINEEMIRPHELAKAREELASKISSLSDKKADTGAIVRMIPEILAVVEDLSSAEFVTLVQELISKQSNKVDGIVAMILSSVAAESDPVATLSSDLSSMGEGRLEIRTTAFAALLRENRGAALRWLEEQEELEAREERSFRRLVTKELFSSDPQGALDYLRQSDLTQMKFAGIESVLPPNLTPTQTAQLVDALSKEPDVNLRKLLSGALVHQTVEKEGISGLSTIVDQLYSEDEVQLKAEVLLKPEIYKGVQSAEEAEAFIDYASTYSDDFAETALRNIISDWALRDYTAAGEYLQTLPESSQRDAGIVAFANQVSRVDPAAALDWAASIQDQEKAGETEKRIFDRWLKNGKVEAEEWARENGKPGL